MKKLTILTTLIFSLMFSSTSFAEWTKVVEGRGGSNIGDTFYVDFGRIKKNDGYVYFWTLSDYLKPNQGYMSDKKYNQGDCKLFRFKGLGLFLHKEPMGSGTGELMTIPKKYKVWIYPPPNSVFEPILKEVCSR